MPSCRPPAVLLKQQAVNQARPREVAEDAVRVAFNAIDTNRDERISLDDIYRFVRERRLNVSEQVLADMFDEARRNLCCVPFAVDLESPLRDNISPQDVVNEVKFRQRFPSGEWVCKPFRDEWIFLIHSCLPEGFNIFFPRLPDLPTNVVVRDTRERVEWEAEQMRHKASRSKTMRTRPLPPGRNTLKTRADGLHDEGLLGVTMTGEGVNERLEQPEAPTFTFASQAAFNGVVAGAERASLYCRRELQAARTLQEREEEQQRKLEESRTIPEFSTIFASGTRAESAASLLGPPNTNPKPFTLPVTRRAEHEEAFRVSVQVPPNNQTLKMGKAKDEAGLWGESVYANSNKPNIHEFREEYDPRVDGKPRFRLAV